MKISHSQISDFQKCELKFHIAHVMQLKPKGLPEPMRRGLQGHSALEEYFKTLETTQGDYAAAESRCLEFMMETLDDEFMYLMRPIAVFMDYVKENKLRATAVEERTVYPVGDDEYVFTPDAVLVDTQGIRKGSHIMVDYKFSSRDWSQREVDLYQQVPKYVAHWNEIHPNLRVSRAAVVVFNVRPNPKFPYKFHWLDLNKTKLDRIVLENEILVGRTAEFKRKAEEHGVDSATRCVDAYVCKMCVFADDLCPMLLRGQDITKTVKYNYERNDYFDQYESTEKIDNG